MSNEVALPDALSTLEQRLRAESSAQDLLQVLRALQRLGLSKEDMNVHVERIRAVNEVLADDPVIEENSLLALDMIAGNLPNLKLSWEPAEIASIYVPRCVDADLLQQSLQVTVRSNDLLPSDAMSGLSVAELTPVVDEQLQRLATFSWRPSKADFYRAPKLGFTSRPAAVLAPSDRLLYAALTSIVASTLNDILIPQVLWPRGFEEASTEYSEFNSTPKQWSSRYVIRTDVESFYESISHSFLTMFLGARARLRPNLLHSIEGFLGATMGADIGLPQGLPGSEVLASAFLSPIDQMMQQAGWTFVRYADDYLIAAESVVDARGMIEFLESAMRDIGLRLNPSKTKLMGHSKYVSGLQQPSPRIQKFRARMGKAVERTLRNSEDRDEVGELLENLGATDQVLWDLLYHHTLSIDEVIESLRDQLEPSMTEGCALYLADVARSLRRRDLLPDMSAAEEDIQECLIILASSRRIVPVDELLEVLKWFPRLAQIISAYLGSIVSTRIAPVRRFVKEFLQLPPNTDWVMAWISRVVEEHPAVGGSAILGRYRTIAHSADYGMLTRSSALRILAAGGQLDQDTLAIVLKDASFVMVAELKISLRPYVGRNHALSGFLAGGQGPLPIP